MQAFLKKSRQRTRKCAQKRCRAKFSDLEVIALSLTAESLSIDSENCLFVWLNHHRDLIPNLISRRQFNTRRKLTISVCNAIRERIANEIDGGESFFCIDSKPIEVCRIARSSRCKLGKSDYETVPSFGFCASQNTYYYGYKLHAVCGLSGVIHSFDITNANVHDIKYLKDVKFSLHYNMSIISRANPLVISNML